MKGQVEIAWAALSFGLRAHIEELVDASRRKDVSGEHI